MISEAFIENFRVVARAPNGISQLRRLISHLALSGGLFDVNDDATEVADFLASVDSSREKAMKAGNIKKIRGTTPIELIEKPHAIPTSWHWVSLERVAYPQAGFAFKSTHFNNLGKGLPLVRIRDVGKPFSGTYYDGPYREEFVVEDGDHLVAMDGEFRIARWQGGKALLNQRVTRLIHHPPMVGRFTEIALARALTQVQGVRSYTTVDHLSGKQIAESAIPFPPLEEQKRIVAKVDELMQLCDDLDERLRQREILLPLLSKANHERFLQSPTVRTLSSLFLQEGVAVPEDLRRSVLSLSIRGKLSPAGADEKDGDETLRAIKAHRGKHDGKRRSKRVASQPHSAEAQRPYPLPEGWIWTTLGEVVVNRDGERIPLSKSVREKKEKIYDYYGASGIIDKTDSYIFDDTLLLVGEDGANLLSRTTPIAFLARGEYWVNNHAHVLDGVSEVFLKYLAIHLNAIDLEPYVTGTAQPKMNQKRLHSIPIALPPSSMWEDIVARVESLIDTIDRLENQYRKMRRVQEQLCEAAIAVIVGPAAEGDNAMQPPKNVVNVKLLSGRSHGASEGSLSTILSSSIDGLDAKTLWHRSGLEIVAFYRQLKLEMANGWITEAAPATMQELKAEEALAT